MTESQRQFVPRDDSGELETALAFLRFARECLLKKAAGLEDEQLRRVLVPTGTNLLGLIQHMAVGERYWFGHHVAGQWPLDTSWDFSMAVADDRATDDVLRDYRAACAESDAIIRSVGRPDALTARPVHDERRTLRWVITHVMTETTRHAGHADILRELIDGVTGR